ncbi:dual specificity protein kinase TTK [Anopheles darlingi]|uniref:dual specificity protein kinase TTK n=1 Tax=Anopheles darlingi TaxID=43151 RepID=UPI00210048F1|nr:dual specificity protein kinase TTK [Anopheles darlingi]
MEMEAKTFDAFGGIKHHTEITTIDDHNSREKESSEERSPRCFRATRSFQPKRVSELPPLESDSDSDGDGNLNCAILNDSFLLTPSKCAEDFGSAQKKSVVKSTAHKQNNDTIPKSRMKLEDKLSSSTEITAQTTVKRHPLTERPVHDQLQINNKDRSPTKTGSSNNEINTEPSNKVERPPKLDANGSHSPPRANVPGERSEADRSRHQFVTPRDKFPVVQMRGTGSRMLTSTALRGSRDSVENEFKSQKILFATPLAIARAPVMSMANDSLNLSLLDTPVKQKEPSILTPIEEHRSQSSTKRSADKLFGSCEPAPPLPEPVLVAPTPKVDIKCDSTAETNDHQQPPKERLISINGKDYLVMKKLGSGGSSSVFLAKQVSSGLECAVKLVNLNGDANLVEGYLNETRLLAKLQTNENVIALYDYAHIPEAGQLFLVMEKGECDLHRILQTYTKDIPLYSLVSIWHQMVQCVHYIHEKGVIHLDLKPANFLMIRGRLKLIDFGIASNISYDSTSIMKFSQAGTFNYISPEALIDTSSDMSPVGAQPRIKMSKKSDIWSLGCILYLLLYKRTPFAHIKNVYTKVNAITNPSTVIEYPALASYYPAMLLDILKRCLRYDAKTRASTAELLEYPYDMLIPLNKLVNHDA